MKKALNGWHPEHVADFAKANPEMVTVGPDGTVVPSVTPTEFLALVARYPRLLAGSSELIPSHTDEERALFARYPSMAPGYRPPK